MGKRFSVLFLRYILVFGCNLVGFFVKLNEMKRFYKFNNNKHIQ